MDGKERESKYEISPFGGRCSEENWDKKIDKERSVRCSYNRTKNKVYELARCSEWDVFVTWTFNPVEVDRYDFDVCSQKIRTWLNNTKKRQCPNMKYIVVPEQHKDGAWHFHGLLSDVPELKMTRANTKDEIYNVDSYKWGFTTATRVRDTHKASSYICKYITKTLVQATPNKQRYYVSKGLEKPTIELYGFDTLDDVRNSDELLAGKKIAYVSQTQAKDVNMQITYIELS